MRRLVRLFAETHRTLASKHVLIIDDEADFASIRFTRKKGSEELEQGRIAETGRIMSTSTRPMSTPMDNRSCA